MIVENLTLKNFRNHSSAAFSFHGGINLLTGPNGVGKTNIVEAIYYLSLGRSFRAQDDKELIHHHANDAEILANIKEGNISRRIKVIFSKQGRSILVNDKPIKKLSELSQLINVLLFEPNDVNLFRGSPKERRNFLDINISKKSHLYLEYLSRYHKILKQRNDILKEEIIDDTLLKTTTEMLVKASYPIVLMREAYVKDINDILINIARALAGKEETVHITYQPFVEPDDSFVDKAKNAFNQALEGDLKRKATSIGVHREDFLVTQNGKDIASFGSQGENRLIALALILTPYFLIKEKDKKPIVVLDDVLSELDQGHRTRLINFIQNFEQVFITGTNASIKNSVHYQLTNK